MKKILIILASVALFSCSKSGLTKTDFENGINETAIKQVLNANEEQLQKNMFNSLNAEEKSKIWVDKYENYLNSTVLNHEQELFIKKLIGIIKPQYYSSQEYKSKIKISDLKNEAISLFGAEQAINLLTTLNSSKLESSSLNCKCNVEDDWCFIGSDCRWVTCNESSSGCGTWLGEPCEGRCK